MSKAAFATIVAAIFFVTGAAASQAATVKCEVVSIQGTTVTVTCGDKASELTKGDKVTVKGAKKKDQGGC